MHISSKALGLGLEVLFLKGDSRLVRVGYDEKVQPQRKDGDERGGEYVRDHHPVEADSTRKDGYYLRIRSHLRGEEYDRDEHEQRTEHIHKIWNEVHIIIEYDSPERSFLLDKVVNPLTDIEYDYDTDDKKKCHKECGYELLDDVDVDFSWS